MTEKLGRLLMKRHEIKYKQLLKKLDIQEEIFDRYVDDETEGLAALEPGVKFERGKLVIDKDKVEQDKEKAPSLNENGRLPVLDLNLRVANNNFEHEFFQKPCTSETVIPYTFAHSRNIAKGTTDPRVEFILPKSYCKFKHKS